MTERSWYQVDRIISEKYERRGTRLEKFYEVSWVPTWERAKRIKEQVPVIVEAYEKKKRSSARINCESESVETKPEVLVPQKKVRIVGVADDDGKDIKSATMVLRKQLTSSAGLHDNR
ncbi:unnamed protein product [Thelazia callipaeda]|uniref:Chromo domain-containing protein n=1 Tax=Thelazia callipaeda TaxID=103827 RepID=A0A0N5D6U1_THECL|nr:unnamed protein product [Thelazia callipaeda]